MRRFAAGLLAARFGIGVQVHPSLDEIDRGSTGYLPRDEHDCAADALFAQPRLSHCGWERAADVQARAVRAWEAIMAPSPSGPIAVVGHGGAGTLLLCHLAD